MKKRLIDFFWSYWQLILIAATIGFFKLLSLIPNSELFIMSLPYPLLVFSIGYSIYKGLGTSQSADKKEGAKEKVVFAAKFIGCWIVIGGQLSFFIIRSSGIGTDLIVIQMAVLFYLLIGMFIVKLVLNVNDDYDSGAALFWVMYPVWWISGIVYLFWFLDNVV
jgi:hypothetical protein